MSLHPQLIVTLAKKYTGKSHNSTCSVRKIFPDPSEIPGTVFTNILAISLVRWLYL